MFLNVLPRQGMLVGLLAQHSSECFNRTYSVSVEAVHLAARHSDRVAGTSHFWQEEFRRTLKNRRPFIQSGFFYQGNVGPRYVLDRTARAVSEPVYTNLNAVG